DNFSEARNAAIKHATGDWILVLDADEQLDSAARKAIQKAVKSPTANAYELLFRNYRSDGSPADAFIHPTCRLFRNRPEYSYTGRVHEQIVPSITAASGTVGRLNVHIDHYGYKPEVMKERGKHEKYIRLLKEDLEENPGSVQCMYNLGAAYSSAGEHELAVEWYEQAAEAVRPEHGFYAQAVFFSLVNSLCLAGKPADALAAAERAERLRIKHPELCCGKGTAYLILQRYQEAIAQFQKALQLGQSGVWTGDAGASGYKAYYGLGWAQVGLGNYQKAVEFCKKALNENPNDEKTHEVIAHAYLCLGKTAECETHLKKWTSIKPDDTRAWTKLAEFYLNQGRPSDAEACYKILSDCGGKAAEVELGLGMCARMEGRLEEAEQHLKQATKLNTDCAKGFTELGRVQGEFGRVGEALQSFVRALEIDPSQVDAYFDAGRLLFSSGMYQEAANVLQNGLSVNPENAEGFLMLGDCYLNTGADDAAVLAYRQALVIKPDYPEATERLAEVEKSPVQLKAA
ncbi:MAG TPA: tetratricopeptide repeat protein, partial [Armatimonadota bacterium]|nr:tetratricopeptide repeat protein [Armatimonadota bacterium]